MVGIDWRYDERYDDVKCSVEMVLILNNIQGRWKF